MKKSESPQLSQIMMVLHNINDNLRRINDNLERINDKFDKQPTTIKHIVLLKQQDKTKKETQE